MKNNIDDFFKDGLSQNDFEYNEKTWNGFKDLYEQEKEDEPVAVPFFNKTMVIGALILLSMIGWLYFSGNKSVVNTNNPIIPVTDLNSNNTTNVKEKETLNNVASNTKEAISSDTKTNQNSVLNNKQASSSYIPNAIETPNAKETSVKKDLTENNDYQNTSTLFNSTTDFSNAGVSTILQEPKGTIIGATSTQRNVPESETTITQSPRANTPVSVFRNNAKITLFNELPTLTIAALDNEPIQNDKDFSLKVKRKMRGHFFLMGAAGMGNIKGKNYEFGVGKNFQFNKYLGLNIGVKYRTLIANTLEQHRGFDTKYSRANRNFYGNHIEADQMYYAAVPLSIELAIRRHRINVGGTYNRMFLVKGTITKEVAGDANVPERHTAWIVETGMNKNLFSTNVSYGFQMSPAMQVFVNAEMFLTDSYNNESTINHKFNAFNAGLKYNLKSFRKYPTLRFL